MLLKLPFLCLMSLQIHTTITLTTYDILRNIFGIAFPSFSIE
jgi:hypothetical protein